MLQYPENAALELELEVDVESPKSMGQRRHTLESRERGHQGGLACCLSRLAIYGPYVTFCY